jgi:hypothetical protein
MKATFDEEEFLYSIDGQAVDELTAKASSQALSRQFKAQIRLYAQQLQNEQISLQDAYELSRREIKLLHMSEYALANGGIDRVEDWSRVEQIVEQQLNGMEGQYPGFRRFYEDIERGRYGKPGQPLSSEVLARQGAYANAGVATYENERLAARMRLYPMEARRIRGFLDSCRNCIDWAALGWMDAETMYQHYPIASSICNVNCYCNIVSRRKRVNAEQSPYKVLPAILTGLGRAGAATGGLAIGALVLLRIARSNPGLTLLVLRLLGRAIGL